MSTVTAQTGARTTSLTRTYPGDFHRTYFVVTATTDYGWTADSVRSATITCNEPR